jgi:hypothetical protein
MRLIDCQRNILERRRQLPASFNKPSEGICCLLRSSTILASRRAWIFKALFIAYIPPKDLALTARVN